MREPMRQNFTKMQALGNDFVILDGREEALPEIARGCAAAIADRRRGIGCDQLVVLEPSTRADFRMRIFNADGGEVEACGNAARAVALLHGAPALLETDGGLITLAPFSDKRGARVDMGIPRFGWEDIPLEYAMDTASMPVSYGPLADPICVNIGNPHIVFFVPDCDAIALEEWGPQIEHDPLFPQQINVNIASVHSRDAIRLRVWERGVGETSACGTGACASAIAAMRRGLVERSVCVTLSGGPLHIEWDEHDHIQMSGPAKQSFTGVFDWDDFA